MSKLLIVFASQDGQTRKIAHFLADQIREQHIDVLIEDLSKEQDFETQLDGAQAVVVISAIRYGHHLRPAENFLESYRDRLTKKRLALLSVSLTARKTHKRMLENSVYLKNWVKRHSLSPDIISAIAGKLNYPIYSFFDRAVIRFIMTLTKGPTDPKTSVEFTDWDQVKELSRDISKLVET